MDLNDLIIRQILPTFKMLEEIIEQIDDDLYQKRINNYHVWKLLYHPIYWIDYHLSYESGFQPAPFHKDTYHQIEILDDTSPSKKGIYNYLSNVKKKLLNILKHIDPENSKENVSALDKIIGQIRHTGYHIGVLHFLIFQNKGIWPDYIGPEF